MKQSDNTVIIWKAASDRLHTVVKHASTSSIRWCKRNGRRMLKPQKQSGNNTASMARQKSSSVWSNWWLRWHRCLFGEIWSWSGHVTGSTCVSRLCVSAAVRHCLLDNRLQAPRLWFVAVDYRRDVISTRWWTWHGTRQCTSRAGGSGSTLWCCNSNGLHHTTSLHDIQCSSKLTSSLQSQSMAAVIGCNHKLEQKAAGRRQVRVLVSESGSQWQHTSSSNIRQ